MLRHKPTALVHTLLLEGVTGKPSLGNGGWEVNDLSESLSRIEKRLEYIARPTLQTRSSVERLLLRVESLEAQVKRL